MSDVRISRESDYDPRHYAFQRYSGTKRSDFRDPMEIFIRWRHFALAVLVIALVVAGFTASDVASW